MNKTQVDKRHILIPSWFGVAFDMDRFLSRLIFHPPNVKRNRFCSFYSVISFHFSIMFARKIYWKKRNIKNIPKKSVVVLRRRRFCRCCLSLAGRDSELELETRMNDLKIVCEMIEPKPCLCATYFMHNRVKLGINRSQEWVRNRVQTIEQYIKYTVKRIKCDSIRKNFVLMLVTMHKCWALIIPTYSCYKTRIKWPINNCK